MPLPKLTGRVALVTGGSRGIGRGISLQLGEAGATVYITGRNSGDLEKTCNDVVERGGNAIGVVMDHSIDKDVEDLFEKIDANENGKLDICVNNAYAGVSTIFANAEKSFWETPADETWDAMNRVGLRNHYLCTVRAARMMVPRKSGLIVNVSSSGGLHYLFNPAYGAGKAAVDRMAADCAHELQKHQVTMVSLWPGPVKTEEVVKSILNNPSASDLQKQIFGQAESIEFSGRAVVYMAADPKVHKKTGKIVITSELAQEYGYTDLDGLTHSGIRSVKGQLAYSGWITLAKFVPEFIKVPYTFLHFAGYKF